MSECNIFSKTFANATTGNTWNIQLGWLQSLIPPFNPATSGIWQPIILTKQQSGPVEYGKLLSNPKNTNDTEVAPCECSLNSNRISRNIQQKLVAFSEYWSGDPEDGIFCEYCQGIRTEDSYNNCLVSINYRPKREGVQPATLFWPVPGNGGGVFTPNCCQGGCDTRALTDDLAPKIPYLYTNYHTKFSDFKYHKQFPSITNPGIGYEKFATYNGSFNGITISNMQLHIDWTLEPRIGEIETPNSHTDTYHTDMYSHKKSYKNYLLSNKTCGNFILTQVNTSTTIAALQEAKMVKISGINLGSGIRDYTSSLDTIIPPVEKFTIPYGIKDNTHWNIFLKKPFDKEGGFWKWNISSGIVGWYRYYDINASNDIRPIAGIDLYVSDGDVFFATNDGPEPNAELGGNGNCESKVCPSGLKLSNYTITSSSGQITVVPSGSEFIYISANIYDKVFSNMEKIINKYRSTLSLPNITYKQILSTAAILATGPEFDDITVDTFSNLPQYTSIDKKEFIHLMDQIEKPEPPLTTARIDTYLSTTPVIDIYGRDAKLVKNLTDKPMVSYNGLNMIRSTGDLIDTLIHKYGSYLFLPKNSVGYIEIDNKTRTHAAIDINFEPVVLKSDTYNSTRSVRPIDCSSTIRGTTKVFGYDQKFEIGSSSISSKVIDSRPVYNTICTGDPPRSTINSVVNTMSVYANNERVFTQAIGESVTKFVDIYSRFPSISSVLPSPNMTFNGNVTEGFNFQNLNEVEDDYDDIGVYFLTSDKQLRLNRSYNAIAAHSAIDLVAFHQDGGFFYDSTMLNKYPGTGTVAFIKNYKPNRQKHKPKITFETYDLALKIYDANIYKLRDPNNLSCKTMPIDQTCKCWGLDIVENYPFKCGDSTIELKTPNLYTPFLSTASNPGLAYGGYSLEKVQDILGDFRIPHHPAPGNSLPFTDKSITLNNVLGCKYTASMTLSTYVNTTWKIRLPDWDTTNGDIWVHFTDNDDFAQSRNGTKILINDIPVNANTQVNLGKIGRELTIVVTNIFLDALFGDDHPNLYHPNIFPCSTSRFFSNDILQQTRSIGITFGLVPTQTKVVFSLPAIQSLGKFNVAKFDPNSGVIGGSHGSALELKNHGMFIFNYDHRTFNNDNTVTYDTNHKTYSGIIDLKQALRYNNLLDLLLHSKKSRLYIKNNGFWYEYEDHRSFGYRNLNTDTQYYGWPTIFSQNNNTSSEQNIGNIIPAIPKEPLEYVYMPAKIMANNENKVIKKNLANKLYPLLDLFFIRDPVNHNIVYIEGSRPYFALLDRNNKEYNDTTGRTFYVLNEDISYEYKEIDNQFYETAKTRTIIPVFLTNKNTVTDNIEEAFSAEFSNNIDEKSIVVNLITFATGNINYPLVKNKYNNIFTKLKLSKSINIPYGNLYVAKNNDSNNDFRYITLTAFATVPIENSTNFDSLIDMGSSKGQETGVFGGVGPYGSSKWSDKYYYTSYDILNSQIIEYKIKQAYNPYTYTNTLSQLISNNLYRSQYKINTLNTNVDGMVRSELDPKGFWSVTLHSGNVNSAPFKERISFSGIPFTHYIHRPFSLGRNEIYDKSISKFNLFKNENGLIDINLLTNSSSFPGTISQDLIDRLDLKIGNNIYDFGILKMSGLHRPAFNMPPSGILSDKINLLLDLDPKFRLKPIPISVNASVIYSDTFVINDPYDVYAGISISNTINPGADTSECTNIIIPNIGAPGDVGSSETFNWARFNKETTFGDPYIQFPILCDKDTGTTCSKGTLSITPIGSIKARSRFHNYLYQYDNISSLGDEIELGISIDAGLYTSLGTTKSVPYISRANFSNYTPILPTYNLLGSPSCIGGASYVPFEHNLRSWDGLFQTEIANNLVNNLNIDIWANEIIFRSLYGSKEKINSNNIAKAYSDNIIDRQSILDNLVNKTSSSLVSLYDSIPMDYDTAASPNNLKIGGTINIIGKGGIGDVVRFYFNDVLYNIRIIANNNGDIISECAEINAKGLLWQNFVTSTSYSIREVNSGGSTIIGDNMSENIVGSCRTAGSSSVSASCVCGGGGEGYKQKLYLSCFPYDTCYVNAVDITNDFYPEGVGGSWPSFSVPSCSAFPIIDKNSSNSAGPIDGGWTRYGVSYGFNAPVGGESVGLECGSWSASVGQGTSCCTDNLTGQPFNNGRSVINYNINNCHYSFTLKGVIENSIHRAASLNFVYPTPNECTQGPPIFASEGKADGSLCDCNNPDQYCYGGGSGKFVNCEAYIQYCVPVDEGFSDACNFANFGACCEDFCSGSSFPRRPGFCFKYEETQGPEKYEIFSSSSPGIQYEVVETTTISSSNTAYTANCNKFIASIIYDNNQLKINLGAKHVINNIVIYNGGNCTPHNISQCPNIRVIFPDATYSANYVQNNDCTTCRNQNNIIEITESPTFNLITETRYCILGIFSYVTPMESNRTAGFPCPGTPSQTQSLNYRIRECNKPLNSYYIGETAYSAWHYYLPSPALALETLQKPEKSACSLQPYLPDAVMVGASDVMSNPTSAQAAIDAWKSNMNEAYLTKSFCFNGGVDEDDIIEGPIPGSCSLSFAGGSWPVWAVRTKRSLTAGIDWEYDSEVSQTSASSLVAYVSYSYKRPVSIGEQFIDEEIRGQCASFFGPAPKNHGCPGVSYNMKEVFKSRETIDSNCVSNPTCYDSTKGCAPNYYCCGGNLIGG